MIFTQSKYYSQLQAFIPGLSCVHGFSCLPEESHKVESCCWSTPHISLSTCMHRVCPSALTLQKVVLTLFFSPCNQKRTAGKESVGYLTISFKSAAAAAKSLQSCPTLCDPRDGSPPGSPVPGILQARTLEGVAISFSNAWKWKVKVKSLSCVRLLATPWTVAYQATPSMGFSRQEDWSGLPLPSPSFKSSLSKFRKGRKIFNNHEHFRLMNRMNLNEKLDTWNWIFG